MRSLFGRVILIGVVLALLPKVGGAQVTVYRDPYGVPSIVAEKLSDAVYGLGYAMATDNAERMARNFKQARGRLSEVEGKSQLLTDGFLRALGIEELAEQKAATLEGEQAVLMRQFCAGANKALAEQKSVLPDWIEPFTPTDVLALAQLLNAAFPLQDISSQLLPGTGSNQFAVGAKRSATGHAILSADPHLNWSGPLLWYEFTYYTKEFHFHGVTLSGLPFGAMGHTDKIAWCMTNNNPDLFDFFTIKTNPDNSKQYSYHGEWRDFEEVSFELKYREDGQLKSRKQTARRTAWGPMVPLRPQAVKLSMLGSWGQLDQSLQMARAQNAHEFREALRPCGLSMWNLVYADTQGNIGYQFNARVPHRDESFDWNKPVPGFDPKTKWGELWTIDELPHVENPKSNLLINANSSPWLTPQGDEIKSTGWPSYITTYGPTTRYERLAALLSQDHKITLEAAKRYATDTEVPYAKKAVLALTEAVTHQSGEVGADTLQGISILKQWNGRAEVEAKGCGLYLAWLLADRGLTSLAQKASRGEAWSGAEQTQAATALTKAIATLRQEQRKLDAPWGEIHVSKRGNVTVPVTGMAYFQPGDATATVTPNFGALKDGKITCVGGSSFRMIVHLDPKGVQSWSILPYGISQDPANPHYADQMALFGRGVYKDTFFGLARTKKAAVSRITLATH